MVGARRFLGRLGKVGVVAALVLTTVAAQSAGAQLSPAACTLCAGGEFFPVTPQRVFDTRDGTGGRTGALPFGQSADVAVTGVAGVPASGVLAVALNITVDQPNQAGYLTAFPAGTAAPVASNVNFTPGNPVANFVVVGVGTGGKVSVTPGPTLPNAQTHVIVDVVGYYATSAVTTHGSRLRPLTPARVLDTRSGTGGVAGPLGNNAQFDIKLRGAGGVPDDSSVTAVILNLTGTEAARTTYVQATPTGTTGTTSSLNLLPGQNKANLAMVPLSADGRAHFFNLFGPMQLIGDVVGLLPEGRQRRREPGRAGRAPGLAVPRHRDPGGGWGRRRQAGSRPGGHLGLPALRVVAARHQREHGGQRVRTGDQRHRHRAQLPGAHGEPARLHDGVPRRRCRRAQRVEPQLRAERQHAEPGRRAAVGRRQDRHLQLQRLHPLPRRRDGRRSWRIRKGRSAYRVASYTGRP